MNTIAKTAVAATTAGVVLLIGIAPSLAASTAAETTDAVAATTTTVGPTARQCIGLELPIAPVGSTQGSAQTDPANPGYFG